MVSREEARCRGRRGSSLKMGADDRLLEVVGEGVGEHSQEGAPRDGAGEVRRGRDRGVAGLDDGDGAAAFAAEARK